MLHVWLVSEVTSVHPLTAHCVFQAKAVVGPLPSWSTMQ